MQELISALREFLTTYGVPDQLATDGGSNYMAQATQTFLKTWGVSHIVSSAYHPHSNSASLSPLGLRTCSNQCLQIDFRRKSSVPL